jgi:hypothetical protein
MPQVTRRSFVAVAALLAAPLTVRARQAPAPARPPSFPTQDPDLVREVVGVSHNNLARLRELVDRQPSLARAAWDWGFGDWESALGAASHVGNRDIALYLLSKGARPSIFSAAMLGQVAVVRAFIEAQPGIQRTKGPHGIPLFAHATAGGAAAAGVVEYLKTVGDADVRVEAAPLAATDRDRLVGVYPFGDAADERFEVTVARDTLWIARTGRSPRGLIHRGNLEFSPVGADAVRIRFTEAAAAITLTVLDPDVVAVARR